jgi:hypothetical protein
MTRGMLRAFALVASGVLVAWLRAADLSTHVDDPTAMLPHDPPAAEILETKLAGFERTAGVRILVRFHTQSPSADEDAQPGVFMRALARRLGVAQRGVLAVYFADEDDWRVWIGDELTATFAGRPGTVEELTESDAIHNAKEVFFTTTRTASDAAFAALQRSASPDRPPTSAQRVDLHACAIVDGLIAKFGAHASTSTLNLP